MEARELYILFLRCNIPVIVMGETGCGKTRLIRYMCGLLSGSGGPRNMLLVKVGLLGALKFIDLRFRKGRASYDTLTRQTLLFILLRDKP